MFWIICCLVIAAEAAKLDKTYLPPSNANEAGGSDSDLQVPLEPPYIDPYTPHHSVHKKLHPLRPGTRSLVNQGRPFKPSNDDQSFENEDDIVVPTPLLGKGRFISGSYSYTGPDNVLVTVTYKADDRKGRDKDNSSEEVEEEQPEQDGDQEEEVYSTRSISNDEESGDDGEDGIIPTPPSLPAELARAFDFHKRKQQEAEERTHKTNINKKPAHGGHKQKGTHSTNQHKPGSYGMKINPSQNKNQSGYHPQNTYGTPTIHQGYSYPKQN